jgi:hypothetical protein
MSRHESDRENLMAEATALRQRVELSLPGDTGHVVAGFRDNGCYSLYFGSDPVFHFDSAGGLRRAFVAGDLYRSLGQTLARLTRKRTDGDVHLVRHDLEPSELESFIEGMREQLQRLHAALADGAAQVVQELPIDGNLKMRLLEVLDIARRGRLSASIRKR